MRALAAIVLGGLLLIWPAFLNSYPIVFSDTGAFLAQTVVPLMIWDKPYVYGPLAFLAHWHVTLWGVVVAQGLVVSHLLWVLARVAFEEGEREARATPATAGHAGPGQARAAADGPDRRRGPFGARGALRSPAVAHLLLCALLAALTTAPWSAALVMPDILTPAAILCAALAGWGWAGLSRGERAWVLGFGAVATASHLSNLPVVFAVAVLALLLRRWRAALRVAVPLAGAVAILLATNAVGHGRLAISPYGSTFLLARLVADGPAARTVEARCPESGWYLCAFAGRLPTNSDVFLWEPDSPVNMAPDGTPILLGGMRLAEEARAIVSETLRREPLTVARLALENFARQLALTSVGDTLSSLHVGVAVRPRIEQGFPAAERARFDAALQQRDELAPLAARIAWLHPLVLALAAPFALLAWRRAHRAGDARRLGLTLALLVGVAGNALATGALSMPHHRYQARVAWLLPVVALVLYRRGERPEVPVAASRFASAVR